MHIAELFFSIQGEGQLVGVPSAFVRTSGCNLRCWFCDTPYSSWDPEGQELSVEDILTQLQAWPTNHIVITGGEPMLMPELPELTQRLKRAGKHITIETAGTVLQPVQADLMSISPKLSNSTPWQRDAKQAMVHEQRRHNPSVIRRLVELFDYQCKFVIDQPADVGEVELWLQSFPEIDRRRVFLMPQAVEREELLAKSMWLAEHCKRTQLRLGSRMHIELYGHQRGT